MPIKKIGHVAYTVPDVEATAKYYEQVLGLAVTKMTGDTYVLSSGGLYSDESPVEVVFYQGNEIKLHHIALEVENDEDLQICEEILLSRNIKIKKDEFPQEFGQKSISFEGPFGKTLEIVTSIRKGGYEYRPIPFRITKFGHVTMKTPEPSVGKNFFEEILDFRLSEAIGENFFWLRCNVDHHTIAYCKSHEFGVQHIAFEVASWEDIMRLNDHLMKNNVKIEYGPGRHGPGNNIFIYFKDLNGVRVEVFCDIHRIYNEHNYVPKVWDPSKRLDNVNQWGPRPPESFLD